MVFLRPGRLLWVECALIVMVTRGSSIESVSYCNIHRDAVTVNPIHNNTIQIFNEDSSRNTTTEILRTVKRSSAQLEDIEEAITHLESLQADMAQVLATILTRLEH